MQYSVPGRRISVIQTRKGFLNKYPFFNNNLYYLGSLVGALRQRVIYNNILLFWGCASEHESHRLEYFIDSGLALLSFCQDTLNAENLAVLSHPVMFSLSQAIPVLVQNLSR